MALKAKLETLDDLDETTKALYVERDGEYFLDVEDPDQLPDVSGLKNAYQAEKTKRQEQGQKLAETQAKLDELEAKPKDDRTKADDKEILKLRETLEAERDEWKTKASDLEKQVYTLSVENQLDAAIREAGISEPAFQKAAKRLLSDGVKLADGKPVVDTDMGPLPLAEYVARWASSEGAAFVSKPSGGGAGGGKSGAASTKKPEDMDIQERRDLLTNDPEAFYKAFPQAKLR